ncbi:F-box domain containing protein [Rhynchospora pubera]|uniref:F-box domain containing protein n=1 Tax=Rhynchospora pubera TaxID=906938 RepID=A0AAV8BWG8_9POAL|nr:F-box domain containing protein [Rhynchospora pubera]
MEHLYQDERNWSRLCPELLQLICKNLPDIADFANFRAVCKDWRAAIPSSDYAHREPCLIYYHPYKGARFYVLTSTHWIELKSPCYKEKWFQGLSQGYILIRDEKTKAYNLLNPINGKEIRLPLLAGPYYNLLDVELDEGVPKYVAVCEFDGRASSMPRICQIGDEKWTTVNLYASMRYTFYKPSSSVNSGCCTHGKDTDVKPSVAKRKLITLPESYKLCRPCGNANNLLGVKCSSYKDMSFEIYVLDDGNGDTKWIRTNNIGDQVVFWGNWNCFCWKTHSSSIYKRNSVYFRSFKLFGRFDIGKGTTEILQTPPKGDRWFCPSQV